MKLASASGERPEWLHDASSREHTLYNVHEKRGREGISALGVLPDFHGIAVHDEWAPYWRYRQEGLTHALCNAHHLRELTFVHELDGDDWALEMKELLQEAIHHLHHPARRAGKKGPGPRWIQTIETRYDQLLRAGYRAYGEKMPKCPSPPRAGPRQKRDTGHNLVHRLHFHKRETLAFLRDPRVPFTNSQAERDIRMVKLKQKISGCFRSLGGAKAFLRIRSFLSTAGKQGKNAYLALAEVFPPVDYSVLPET